MARVCLQCGKELSQYYTANFCYACQENNLKNKMADGEDLVDAEGYAALLGLYSVEQLKRLARKDVLAPRIPEIRQWLWRRKDIEDWFKRKQREGDVFRKAAMGIASNLRRCSNDPFISAPFDTVGSIIYGQEYVVATGGAGLTTDLIKLVEVDKSIASKVLEELPSKDFPELEGITDWSQLPYDRIHEAFLIKLEAYF